MTEVKEGRTCHEPTRLGKQISERVAVAKIESMGGMVQYHSTRASTSARLTRWVPHPFRKVREVVSTDAGLEHLKGLSNLQELYLGKTQVTDEGIKKLQQALPNCEIWQ